MLKYARFNKPTVAAIIAIFNPKNFFSKAIDSILTQSFPVDELIIINDGGNESFISDVLPKDPRIKYYFQENKGVSQARNAGIKYTKCDYIAFLDQDDFWYHDKIEKQLELVEFKSFPAFISSPIDIIDEREKILKVSEVKKEYYLRSISTVDPFHALLLGNFIYSSTPIIHRDIFKIIGGFEKKYEPHDDWAMYLKIAYAKFPFFFYRKEPLSVWRSHNSNESANLTKMIRTKSRIERYYLKHSNIKSEINYLKGILAQTNLDRVNILLYKKHKVKYRSLLPEVLLKYFKFFLVNVAIKRRNKFGLFFKSIKRFFISYLYS